MSKQCSCISQAKVCIKGWLLFLWVNFQFSPFVFGWVAGNEAQQFSRFVWIKSEFSKRQVKILFCSKLTYKLNWSDHFLNSISQRPKVYLETERFSPLRRWLNSSKTFGFYSFEKRIKYYERVFSNLKRILWTWAFGLEADGHTLDSVCWEYSDIFRSSRLCQKIVIKQKIETKTIRKASNHFFCFFSKTIPLFSRLNLKGNSEWAPLTSFSPCKSWRYNGKIPGLKTAVKIRFVELTCTASLSSKQTPRFPM